MTCTNALYALTLIFHSLLPIERLAMCETFMRYSETSQTFYHVEPQMFNYRFFVDVCFSMLFIQSITVAASRST